MAQESSCDPNTELLILQYFIETIDMVNIEEKTNVLLDVLTEDTLSTFFSVLSEHRIRKDDMNLELFADLVVKLQERFPEAHSTAMVEVGVPIMRFLRTLPADYFNVDIEMDLRNLGRFLGLLAFHPRNPTPLKFPTFDGIVVEGVRKGNLALRYVIPLVCEYVKGSKGHLLGEVREASLDTLKLLHLIYNQTDILDALKAEIASLFTYFEVNIETFPRLRDLNEIEPESAEYITFLEPESEERSGRL